MIPLLGPYGIRIFPVRREEGRIPAAKIGRAYVLMERDVLNFIEQQIASQTARRGGGPSVGNVVSAAASVGSSGGAA